MIVPKKPPYMGTNADPYKTQGEITKLLQVYGCEGVNWQQDFKNKYVSLRFLVEAEIKGVKRQIMIEITPPLFEAKRRSWNVDKGRYEKLWVPNYAQSYRLLYHYLKSKLEAIAYGLTSVEKEFFAEVVMKLPSGEISTVFEAMVDRALGLPDYSQGVDKGQVVETVEEGRD